MVLYNPWIGLNFKNNNVFEIAKSTNKNPSWKSETGKSIQRCVLMNIFATHELGMFVSYSPPHAAHHLRLGP